MRTCFQEWNLASWTFLELDSSGSQAVDTIVKLNNCKVSRETCFQECFQEENLASWNYLNRQTKRTSEPKMLYF